MVSIIGCPLSVSVLSSLDKNSSIKPPGVDETVLRSCVNMKEKIHQKNIG